MGCEFTKVRTDQNSFWRKTSHCDNVEIYNRELEDGSIQKTKDNHVFIDENDKITSPTSQLKKINKSHYISK